MRLSSLACLFLAVPGLHAQSISGNLRAEHGLATLGYGNVDIFRGDERVASVLTDEWGNYTIALDTGMYRCVVSYDGYVTSTRTVHVKADEKLDFAVTKEKGAPAGRPSVTESRPSATGGLAMHTRHSAAPPSDLPAPFGQAGQPRAASGVLTAGEVNDFAKWTQWTDLSGKALSSLRELWGIGPNGRYTLDLQTRSGLPIADAVVQLRRQDGSLLHQARTDNTGKAELWSSLDHLEEAGPGPLNLAVEHGGHSYRVDRAQPFAHAVNHLVLDVPCGPSDQVDVAFVVDATGSMQDELDFLRAEMNDIIYRSKRIGDRLDFRFAHVFYRDVGPAEAYTTRAMDFTRVLSTAVQFIAEQGADGGGDTPEAVEVALDSAINGLSWSAEARARVLFLLLDAGPHITPEVRKRMRTLTAQAAAKGIRIVPVAASGTDKATEYLLRTLALGTNGTYTFLTDHSGVGRPHMEASTDAYDVESLNGLLVRILKSFTYMPDCQQQLPELALDYPDSTVTAPFSPDSALAIPEGGPERTTINWRYWPNPTAGLVHITADADIPELYVTDLSGKVLQVVRDLPAGRAVLVDLSAYATGIYLLRCPVGSGWRSGKVVLQRA